MPATITKDMYEDLDKAHAMAWMLHGSCEAMDLAIRGEDYKPDRTWFEGAKHVFKEFAELLYEIVNYLQPEKVSETEGPETIED